MHILTPTDISSVAWEGELVAPPVMMGGGHPDRPAVTIGQPEVWPAAEAVQNELGKSWTPPLGDAGFWLLRLACTLRQKKGAAPLIQATQSLYLRPRNAGAPPDHVYAYSLHPERELAEAAAEFTVGLGPELKFVTGLELKLGELGAQLAYRKAFPVIQAYDVGTPSPYWEFRPHGTRPLTGSQFVYAVIAARAGSGGARATVDLTVTVRGPWGVFKFAPPEEAHEHLSFTIP